MDFEIDEMEIYDIPEVLSMLKVVTEQEKIDEYKGQLKADTAIHFLKKMMYSSDYATYVAKDENKKVQGVLLGHVFFSIRNGGFLEATELALQPNPELNKFSAAKAFIKLLNKYEEWADKKQVESKNLSVNVKTKYGNYLKRKGWHLGEKVYYKNT